MNFIRLHWFLLRPTNSLPGLPHASVKQLILLVLMAILLANNLQNTAEVGQEGQEPGRTGMPR